jgi:hypothetical protein
MIRKGEAFLPRQKQIRQMQSGGRDDHAQAITKTPTLRVTIYDRSFADVPAIMETNRSIGGIYSRDFGAQLKKCLLRLQITARCACEVEPIAAGAAMSRSRLVNAHFAACSSEPQTGGLALSWPLKSLALMPAICP